MKLIRVEDNAEIEEERERRRIWDDGLCQFCFIKTNNVFQLHEEIISGFHSLMLICKSCVQEMAIY